MSLSRALLATLTALLISTPVLADDSTVTTTDNASTTAAAVDTQATTKSAISTKVDLNKASVKDLLKLKGMNASRARAVVAYRKKHGNFTTLDTLAKVHGFGKLKTKTLEMIKSQLTVE